MRYNNVNVQQRFGNNNLRAGASNRMDFRGRDGQQVLASRTGPIGRPIALAIVPVIAPAIAQGTAAVIAGGIVRGTDRPERRRIAAKARGDRAKRRR